MNKKNVIILAAAAFLLPVGLYVFKFGSALTDSHAHWGEFGSYLSGVYGSLALVILAYTTYLTQTQFKRQNEDSVFFKLFDSLQNRVANSVIRVDGDELSAHQCSKYIAERFAKELSIEAVEIARLLLWKNPESIGKTQLFKLLHAVRGNVVFDKIEENCESFIKELTSSDDLNIRWENLKYHIGSRGAEGHDIRKALEAIGSVSFYKIPFQMRQTHYQVALSRILSDHGEFLDGYFSSLECIAELAEVATNREIYIKYIQAQLTRYEVIIVFYMLAGQEHPKSRALSFRSSGILNRLKTLDCQSLMLDFPSREDIEMELQHVFAR
ncbi:MAG: hypothetical protein Q7K57_34930 [Burkholderiaceae bacterium]|nr:hypothetical protein [Burkholderiaceae bacterium]